GELARRRLLIKREGERRRDLKGSRRRGDAVGGDLQGARGRPMVGERLQPVPLDLKVISRLGQGGLRPQEHAGARQRQPKPGPCRRFHGDSPPMRIDDGFLKAEVQAGSARFLQVPVRRAISGSARYSLKGRGRTTPKEGSGSDQEPTMLRGSVLRR